ncbi:MAG: hypothetical protein M1816_003919 [Peltula sp. TS41687]|nr:MAG: hypothetical protein M1816_003919 [Peltula sp. TS41687]
MTSSNKQFTCADYHVAWICPLANVELTPARLMLDERHPTPSYDTHYDENTYICGAIKGHAVVLATCPPGETGNINAGRLTGSMFKTFPNIRMAILVGIGGGIPRQTISEDSLENIHLGDVVVGWPADGKPACVYHDRGRQKIDGQFELLGTMQNPDWRLLNALGVLTSDHELGESTFDDQLARLRTHKKFAHPGLEHDRLFKAEYHHIGDSGSKCVACDQNELVQRSPRTEDDKNKLVFHQGRIATGNAVIQSGELRDQIRMRCDGPLCVEMEAAGVDVNRRCLVIRGISDYADSHKNGVWKTYAAGKAAAFARELLCRIQPDVVKDMQGVSEAPWLVPFTRPHFFVGRETQLAQLDEHISSEDCRRLAIYGLGGCGKTALALEAAYRTREQQPTRSIFWVPAFGLEAFEQAYREIALLLRIPGIADDEADVKQLVKTRLSDEHFGQWLMIFDNADDVSVLFSTPEKDSTANRLVDYLPQSRKGSIVFTTRTRKAAIDLAGSDATELGKLDVSEAKEVLRTRLVRGHQHLYENEETAETFVDMLSFLALAIVQAVAFINKTDIPLSDYIALYRKSEKDATELLGKEFEDQNRYRDSKNPVATTWYISFEQIRRHNELAAEYLSFMACTANNDIPVSMLPASSSEIEQIEAIGTLKAYAFISERRHKRDCQGEQTQGVLKAFDVHPLVHLAMRGWLRAKGQLNLCAEKALKRLVEIVPFGDHNTREVWTAYLPHAILVASLPEVRNLEGRMPLLERIGSCEFTLGHYRAAEEALRRLLEQRTEILGKEHTSTLENMSVLAAVLSHQGKYKEAEKMHRETLAVMEKLLGKEHPVTLTSMQGLAAVLDQQGKYTEAERVDQDTLGLIEKVLGKEHPKMLRSMHSLAIVLSHQGRYEEAEKMHRDTLALEEKVLGKEHPLMLISMNKLAVVLFHQKRYKEAETIHRKTLALTEKIWGKEHPHTLTSMNSLALVLDYQGKHKEAEKIYKDALVLDEKVLGKEHPSTLASMNNLALALNNQGEHSEAEKMYQDLLVLREKVLGKEHPRMLTTMSNLALVLSHQGKYKEAEKIHRDTLARRKTVLGKEHPYTLTSMNSLALVLNDRGKHKEAESILQDTLALREKVLGKEHLDTLRSMKNLAGILYDQEKYAEAEKIYGDTLALREKVLGKEHSNTLASMSNLAAVLSRQGKYTQAEKIYRDALVLEEKVLGKEHPSTLASMNNLALTLSNQGKHSEAEKMHQDTLALTEKVLGKEHPDTLTSMNNLVRILRVQKKYTEAENILQDTLALRERRLGKEHPDTLTSMENLAGILSCQGKHAEAENILQDMLALRERRLGKEHPDTLTSMENLAGILSRQGKHAEAENILQDMLALRKKVLGKEHPNTLTSMNNLAVILRRQKKYAEEEKMHRDTLALTEKVLGKEHPDTLTSMNNLVGILRVQKKYTETENILQDTLALREKVLGKEHPDTLTSMKILAGILRRQGKYTEAEKIRREMPGTEGDVDGKASGRRQNHQQTDASSP